MPTEINAKVDLLKVSKDIVEHLNEVVIDLRTNCLSPQGQAQMTALAMDAVGAMIHLIGSLEAAPDSAFAMVPEPAKAGKEAQTQKGHPDAERHQSRQHV